MGAFPFTVANPCQVTVVVTVPGQGEPWKVSGAALRLLVDEVERLTTDSTFIVRAAALHGLHLGAEPASERLRIAAVLAQAARTLRASLLSNPDPTEWEMSLATYLPVLEMWMEGLIDDPA